MALGLSHMPLACVLHYRVCEGDGLAGGAAHALPRSRLAMPLQPSCNVSWPTG